jgi:N-acetylglucosaminyldiphosphoundecaprenol N-acetyl-beta-D-mannosaminyltransferase
MGQRFAVAQVYVDAVQIPEVVAQILQWLQDGECGRYVAVTGMHGVAEAGRSGEVRAALEAADLVVPDGMPLVWLGRLHGHALRRRVYGPELMETFCRETAAEGYLHYFYGGAPGVAEALAQRFERRFPGLRVAGWYTPPFRNLTDDERSDVCERINAARPDVLWVGLSTPRQELWMHENRDLLEVPVMVGVGAAFDFHTERVRQAPRWMREIGLEWSWRLMREPRRLWRRYLIGGPRFLCGVVLELMKERRGHKRFFGS